MSLPPTPSMLRNFTYEIAGILPGKDWSHRFCKRWSAALDAKYLKALDVARFKADTPESYRYYFALLKRKVEEYNVLPCDTYNMDEKGFMLGWPTKAKRIFAKDAIQKKKLLDNLRDGNRERITILATICADGTWLPPGLIYEAVSGNIQDTWTQDVEPDKHQVHFASSPTGWTNDEIGFAYLTQIFDRYSKKKCGQSRRWRLLIVDGHGSHINMRFLDWCSTHRILVAVFPPHTTHRLQPLDVSLFSPLATYYSQELNKIIHAYQGLSVVTKRDFFRLFWPAFTKAFSKDNILSGFQRTGIYPLDGNYVIEQLPTAPTDRPTSQGSGQCTSSSALSANDWRQVRKIFREVIAEVITEATEKKACKINNTLVHITTQNSLLQSECHGLRQAIY